MLGFLYMFVPTIAYASVDTFIKKLNEHIFNPIIYFLITIAIVYFIYGVYEYISNSANDEARKKGQQHMLWGLIGLFIMIGAFFIMKVLLGTVGITEDEINVETGEVNIQPE